jgi:nitrogen fixation protein NifB
MSTHGSFHREVAQRPLSHHLATPTKVAIGTGDGVFVTEHFGFATQFQIWDLAGEKPHLVETRRNLPACGANASADANALMDRSVETVSDCHAVVVARIGECALTRLTALGILAFEADEPVDVALRELVTFLAERSGVPA